MRQEEFDARNIALFLGAGGIGADVAAFDGIAIALDSYASAEVVDDQPAHRALIGVDYQARVDGVVSGQFDLQHRRFGCGGR